jgi:hypothetical protein
MRIEPEDGGGSRVTGGLHQKISLTKYKLENSNKHKNINSFGFPLLAAGG